MEKTIETNKEVVFFKFMCNALGADVETVATVLSSVPDEMSDRVVESVINAETEEQMEAAVELFNTLKSQVKQN